MVSAMRVGRATLLLLDAALAAQAGDLAGRVEDAAGKPIAGAAVLVCAQDSGLPLMAATHTPMTIASMQDDAGPLQAITDERGRFAFEALPIGEYRLIAQSWRGVDTPKHLFETNGSIVELRGVANGIDVEAGQRAEVVLRPAGSASLTIEVDVANDDTLCLISIWPPRADSILGFAGWTGKFLQNAISANRMPDGKTTFTGLPAGKVWFTLFANDNNPGFGDGAVELRNNQVTTSAATLVADWSNARHTAPPALAPLVERARAWRSTKPKGTVAADVWQRYQRDVSAARNPFEQWTVMAKHLDVRLELADGTEVRLGDLQAALAYLDLDERIRKRRSGK